MMNLMDISSNSIDVEAWHRKTLLFFRIIFDYMMILYGVAKLNYW